MTTETRTLSKARNTSRQKYIPDVVMVLRREAHNVLIKRQPLFCILVKACDKFIFIRFCSQNVNHILAIG